MLKGLSRHFTLAPLGRCRGEGKNKPPPRVKKIGVDIKSASCAKLGQRETIMRKFGSET